MSDDGVEDALRRSEQRYRSLVENIPGSVIILFDRELRILLVDGPEVETSGASKEAMEGKLPAECLPPEFAKVVEANFRRVLAGERFTMELPWEDRQYHYEYLPLENNRGEIEHGLVVGQNVTRRNSTEAALRESEQRFRALFEAAPDAFVLHDLAGRILDGNTAASALFGLDVESVRGKTLLEVGTFAPDSMPALLRAMQQSLAEKSAGPEVLRFLRHDGRAVDVELKTVPLKIDGQTVILAAARDVTERVKADEMRQNLEAQLHHAMKMEAIGRLAGGIAHDFNNLLTAVLANIELVAEELPHGDPRRDDLMEAVQASHRAAALVSQLLVFSRKQLIRPVAVQLDNLVGDCIRMLRRMLGETVVLEFAPHGGELVVVVDPGQLEQVLINLAINARDAMPDGGEVRFATCVTNDVDGTDLSPGTYAMVRVSDSGSGIAPDTLARLFEPFFTTKPAGQGTGLGLSTAYGIVNQAGGTIRVQSEVGAGTTFEIWLPIAGGPAPSPERPSARAIVRGHETVLLVEDDESVLHVTERCLGRAGFVVRSATRVEDAIAYASDPSQRIDLLVSDLVMPGLDGISLHQRIAALRPGLRVLFVSGYAEPAILSRANRQPGARFLQKPYSTEALLSRVRAVLDS